MFAPGSALVLALSVAPPTIPTDPDPISEVTILWSANPACDGREVLRSHLRQLLTDSPTTLKASGLVDVRLTPSPKHTTDTSGAPEDSWTMMLRVNSAAGSWSRRIEGESCSRMIEVAILIAAINLDPLAVQTTLRAAGERSTEEPNASSFGKRGTAGNTPPQPEFEPAVEIEPASTARTSSQVEPEDWSADSESRPSPLHKQPMEDRAARRTRHLRVAARAALLGSYGPFPGLGVLFVGGLGMTINDRFLLEVAALQRFRSRHSVEAAPEVAVLASLRAARLDACWTPRRASIELPLCAGLDLGALRAQAIGLQNSAEDRSLYVAPHLGTRLLWRPSPTVGLGLDLETNIALRQRTYGIQGLDEPVLTTTLVGLHGGLSLEIRLP